MEYRRCPFSWFVLFVIYFAISKSKRAFAQDDEDEVAFQSFIAKYNKTYLPGTEIYGKHLLNFKNTLRRITRLNLAEKENVTYGITRYADLAPEEFQLKVLRPPLDIKNVYRIPVFKKRRKRAFIINSLSPIPLKVDWREKKIISSIKNQQQCGACWAFSSVATMESMYALKYQILPDLSVQQIIDCSQNGNMGCNGGDTCLALQWLNKTKDIVMTEKEYPLTYSTGNCKASNATTSKAQLSTYTCHNFKFYEEELLRLLAEHGPLVAAVDASMWQDYLGGIIKYHCGSQINHAVQIVGYDLTGKVPYYIVRNSWGTEFGNNGYIYIAYGKGLCGITSEVATVDIV